MHQKQLNKRKSKNEMSKYVQNRPCWIVGFSNISNMILASSWCHSKGLKYVQKFWFSSLRSCHLKYWTKRHLREISEGQTCFSPCQKPVTLQLNDLFLLHQEFSAAICLIICKLQYISHLQATCKWSKCCWNCVCSSCL